MAKKAATKAPTKSSGFLPEGFEMPASSGDNYLKFGTGDTTFRVISKPLIGWLGWKDKKPHRFATMESATASGIVFDESPRYFWAVVVWNPEKERPQVLEITQKTVLNAIVALDGNAKWGAPYGYDLTVTKSGSGKDNTSYTTTPNPKEKLSDEIKASLKDWKIELKNLLTGDDPFVTVPEGFESPDDDDDGAAAENFEETIVESADPDEDVDDDLPF